MKRPSAKALVTRMSSIPMCETTGPSLWIRRNATPRALWIRQATLNQARDDKRRSNQVRDDKKRTKQVQGDKRCAFRESDRHDTFANHKRTPTNNSVGSSEPEFVALPQADTGRLESCGGPVRFGEDCAIGGDWKRLSEIRGRD